MDKEINTGLTTLIEYDRYLLDSDASERSITHRLGLYYQALFSEWDVDCEFNINLGGPKAIYIEPREFLRSMAVTLEESYGKQAAFRILENDHVNAEDVRSLIHQLHEPKFEINEEFDILLHVLKLRDQNGKMVTIKKSVYPDVIVHQRGTENNLIVIEAKKTTNRIRGARLYDMIKLKCLTTAPFEYKHAYFIDLPIGKDYRKHKSFVFSKGLYGITEVSSSTT